ncbi:MAG: lysophospholipid acyltransferase family protein [Bacteroidia bacterium]|nr:lysophospholipid acyltransferase family protein [Bacteroidia bacterium]
MKRLSYIGFRILVFIISLMPFSILFLFSDFLRFILQKVFRYRLDVINKNIAFCFPEKNKFERLKIANDFYKQFIDVTLESIKGLTYDPEKLVQRYRLNNPEILDEDFANDQSVIILSQHYNNWEWGSICFGLQNKHHIVGVVKKISNNYIDSYIAQKRSQNNVSVVYADNTARYIKYHKPTKPEGLVMIADQYPYSKRHQIKTSFFGKEVSFHAGVSAIAKMSNYPIYSIDIHRIKRGYYQLKYVKLADANNNLSTEEITTMYASHLEELIIQCPYSWLWSHKRFKDQVSY